MDTGETMSIDKIYSLTIQAMGQILKKNREDYIINGLQAKAVNNRAKIK